MALKGAAIKKSAARKLVCFRCGNNMPEGSFYYSPNGITERIPICKECLYDLFNTFFVKYGNTYEALYRMCCCANIVYNKKLAQGIVNNSVEKDGSVKALVGNYVKGVLNMKQYKGMSFLDSDFMGAKEIREDTETKNMIEIEKKDINKWGAGYNAAECQRLNELYSMWAKGTPQDTVTQISLTKDLCKVDLKIEKYTVANKDTKMLFDQKQSLIKALAIDPQTLLKNKQDNEANQCFGSWVAEIEKSTPAEYLSDPKVHLDVDKIESYFNKHFIRTIKNLLLGTKDYPNVVEADNTMDVGDDIKIEPKEELEESIDEDEKK